MESNNPTKALWSAVGRLEEGDWWKESVFHGRNPKVTECNLKEDPSSGQSIKKVQYFHFPQNLSKGPTSGKRV